MIALAQSGHNYIYLNWIASESGPVITKYGKLLKTSDNLEDFKKKHYDILSELTSLLKNEELIFTHSLDKSSLIVSTSYNDDNNPELHNWYKNNIKDQSIDDVMDYYYYSITSLPYQLLTFAIPKYIRKSIKENILSINGRLNNISTGIFSAENGARNWFNANKLSDYLIWKVGSRNFDEILYIHNNQLESYFSISRGKKKIVLNWQFGNIKSTEKIYKYLDSLLFKDTSNIKKTVEKIFLYTCEEKQQDIKNIEKKDQDVVVLLNPLNIIQQMEVEKFNVYDTLYLAETGNAFGNIDV